MSNTTPSETEKLRSALEAAVETIQDYLAYSHDGDPWKEDSRAMGEMDINDYGRDGRLDYALSLLAEPAADTPAPECQYSKDVAMPEYRCAVRCQYEIAADDLVKAERDRCLGIVAQYYGGGRSFVMRKISSIADSATEDGR